MTGAGVHVGSARYNWARAHAISDTATRIYNCGQQIFPELSMTDNFLEFSASLDRYELPAGQPKSQLSCHVDVKPDFGTGEGRQLSTSSSICLVFDCSSSMIGSKFEAAVRAAKLIVDILHERHWLSLIAFQSHSHIVFKNAVPIDGQYIVVFNDNMVACNALSILCVLRGSNAL